MADANSKPKLAYVVGPYRGNRIVENIDAACHAADTLWRHGYAVICPHEGSGRWVNSPADEEILMRGLLEIMKRCDVIVVLRGWESSVGSKRELRVAMHNGKPILLMPEPRNEPTKPTGKFIAYMMATLYPNGKPLHPCGRCNSSWYADRTVRCSDRCKKLVAWRDAIDLGIEPDFGVSFPNP